MQDEEEEKISACVKTNLPAYSAESALYIMHGIQVSLYTFFIVTREVTNALKIEFSFKKIQNLMEKASKKSDKNIFYAFLNGDSARKMDKTY